MTLDLNKVEKSNKTKTDYGRTEDGSYPARIVSVIDLGIQHISDWQSQKPRYHVLDEEGSWAKNGNDFIFTDEPNEAPDLKSMILLTFELPTERIDIEKDDEIVSMPRWMSKEYTLSNHEKAGLTKLINAIAPGITKLGDLIDKPCIISVGSTISGNAKITGVSAPLKGMTIPPLENDTMVFSFDESTLEDFKSLHKWIQDKIRSAKNFEAGRFETSIEEDDTPF